ncbi:MAG: hypothetical protein ABSD88_15435 [Candidatus Korobacteraceae bacterium]
MQRAAPLASANFALGLRRLGQGALGGDGYEGVEDRIVFPDIRQASARQLDGRNLALFYQFRSFGQGQTSDFRFHVRRTPASINLLRKPV